MSEQVTDLVLGQVVPQQNQGLHGGENEGLDGGLSKGCRGWRQGSHRPQLLVGSCDEGVDVLDTGPVQGRDKGRREGLDVEHGVGPRLGQIARNILGDDGLESAGVGAAARGAKAREKETTVHWTLRSETSSTSQWWSSTPVPLPMMKLMTGPSTGPSNSMVSSCQSFL